MSQVWRPSDSFQRAFLGNGDVVRDRDLVDGLAALEQWHAGLEAQPRPGDVEVAGAQERGDLRQRLAVYEYGTYDGFFRLCVMGK
jgi:hypothetical protein